jgi:CRP/FNR family transcriptional regulator, cyclic AMP receptor protein
MLDVAVPRSTTMNPPLVDFFLNPLLGARRTSVPQGSVIYAPSHPASSVYFIHRGQVRVFQPGPDDTAQLTDILGPNDWFGVASLTGACSHGSRAVAVLPSIVSDIPVERVFALLQQQPRAAADMIKALANRWRQARDDAGRLIFDDCHTRLLRALLRFGRTTAASPHSAGVVLHVTHHELAQAIGVARETVSLTLKDLREQGLVRTGRNHLIFAPTAIEQRLGMANGNGQPASAKA